MVSGRSWPNARIGLLRSLPILLRYGGDDFRSDLHMEYDQRLADLFEEAGPVTKLVTLPYKFQGLATLHTQEAFLDVVVPWLAEVVGSSSDRSGIGGLQLDR